MLDTNRIRLMARMTAYENSRIREDQKISSYYRRDYISLNTLITALWITVGYILCAGLYVALNLDDLLENITINTVITLLATGVAIYIVVIIIYCACAANFYGAKHNRAKHRVKRYYLDLAHLEKIMEETN